MRRIGRAKDQKLTEELDDACMSGRERSGTYADALNKTVGVGELICVVGWNADSRLSRLSEKPSNLGTRL